MLPWILCGVLAVIIAILVIKIRMMQKSMDEICSCLSEHLSSDTNQLITVSSSDKHVRHLASEIARQLAELRRQRRQYISGDRELKEAVTNISHDLRTPLTAICGYLDLLEAEEMTDNARRYVEQISNRTEALKALTEELFRYSDDKNVWVATFTDAMLYYCEWSTANVKTTFENGAVTVKLTDKEDDTIFNMPLTVKVTIPSNWKNPVCNGEALSFYTDDAGNRCVNVNIVPGNSVEITENTVA